MNDPDETLVLELTKEELESFEAAEVPINFRSLSSSIVMPSFDSSDEEEEPTGTSASLTTETSASFTTESSLEIKPRFAITAREKALHAKGQGNFKSN
jgi:hypothetical protein